MHGKASKKKINVKSSTESELVGMGKYVPYNIWFIMFMGAQGYAIKNNEIYQDNQSAICMEKNGRNSCTGNSRHKHIRYFFVKDRIDKGEMRVEYCPTHLMLADFFTKPLMGELFRKLRDVIMGYTSIFDLDPTLLQSIKERVGIWVGSDWTWKVLKILLCAFDFVVHARMKLLLTAYFYKIDIRCKADGDEKIDGISKADKDDWDGGLIKFK